MKLLSILIFLMGFVSMTEATTMTAFGLCQNLQDQNHQASCLLLVASKVYTSEELVICQSYSHDNDVTRCLKLLGQHLSTSPVFESRHSGVRDNPVMKYEE